ncbi:MAG: phage portal protein [Clostridiales bacterium]|nr:phage portal protein [Clostridiales bacterium]
MSEGMENLRKKLEKHKRRVDYKYRLYDSKHEDEDIGITIPPAIRQRYKSTLGWCAKAVDTLADRLVFKEFSNDNFELNEIFNLNNPDVFFDSTILSALIGSCCFVYVSKDEDGKARLQIIEGSNATGSIDPITGLLKEGYAVLDRDEYGKAILEAYFLPDRTEIYAKDEIISVIENPSGVPTLVPIIHRPDAVRPFGRSRITRAAIYFQQHAKRTLERADVTAEFYSFPQKYIVGLSQDAEPMEKWKATISSFLQFTKDEDGDSPKLGQFTQPSMSPFTEQLRTLASGFAGETGLTLDDLGFVTDNPSSAEAIKASHETLRIAARKAQRCFGSGFLNTGYVARCLEDNYPYRRDQFYLTKPKWYPVFEPDVATLSGIGDAAIKINQAIPEYFDKDNLSELTGINHD